MLHTCITVEQFIKKIIVHNIHRNERMFCMYTSLLNIINSYPQLVNKTSECTNINLEIYFVH